MVVEELIQNELNPYNLSSSLSKILENTNRERIQMDYKELKVKLGDKGASNKVADLIITNIAGSMVQTVHEGYKGVGKHHLSWESDKLPSGTYFVTLEFESSSLTKKVILLK